MAAPTTTTAAQPTAEQTSRQQVTPAEAKEPTVAELKAQIKAAEEARKTAEDARAVAEAKAAEAEAAAARVAMAGFGAGTITVDHTGKVVS